MENKKEVVGLEGGICLGDILLSTREDELIKRVMFILHCINELTICKGIYTVSLNDLYSYLKNEISVCPKIYSEEEVYFIVNSLCYKWGFLGLTISNSANKIIDINWIRK